MHKSFVSDESRIPSPGSAIYAAMKILKRGSWLFKVGFSDKEKVRRFFWLSDDSTELRWGVSQGDTRFLCIRLDEVVGLSFGPETTAFMNIGESVEGILLPWHCFSLIFVGRTLDLCAIQPDALDWFLSLQTIIASRGFMLLPLNSRFDLVRRTVGMKIRSKAKRLGRSLGEHFRVTLRECSRSSLSKSAGRSFDLVNLKKELLSIRQQVLDVQEAQLDIFQSSLLTILQELKKRGTHRRQVVDSAEQERKRLHNELMELKGNIRVFVRVRPVDKQDSCVSVTSSDRLGVYNEWDARRRYFEFDHVFPQSEAQGDVYMQIEPFIKSFLDGYNVCLFAYGVTNSGKTYTMEGSPENPGIIQRSLMSIFQATNAPCKVHLSCVQIYNENVFDVLNEMNPVELKTTVETRQVPLTSAESGLELFRTVSLMRRTTSTKLNQASSRSHLVVTIQLEHNGCHSKLNLVDLAGSENVNKSGVSGIGLSEAKNINRSLASLGDVIHGLLEAKKGGTPHHVPFRNSKLTMLLKDSLEGNSKTLMIAHLSPTQDDVGETLGTLQFAARVRTVEIGKAKRNSAFGE